MSYANRTKSLLLALADGELDTGEIARKAGCKPSVANSSLRRLNDEGRVTRTYSGTSRSDQSRWVINDRGREYLTNPLEGRQKWPQDDCDRLIEMWSNPAISSKSIALALGRKTGAIYRQAEQFGLPSRNKSRPWTPERLEQLRKIAAEGKTTREAATLMGVAPSTINSACRKYGIEFPRTPAKMVRVNLTAMNREPRPPRERVAPAQLNVVPPTAKPWLEREFGECAFPVAGEGIDTFSCCAPTDGTYCPGHDALMHVKTEPRQAATTPSVIRRRA